MVGDFNADALDPSNAAWKHLVNLASSHDLSNHIIKPTRITASRKSCRDLLFSTPDLVPVSTCVIEAHCSDHCLVLGEFGLRVPSAPASVFYGRDWHKFDLQSFLNILLDSDLDSSIMTNDVNLHWSEWYDKFIRALDTCSSMKLRRERRKKCEWMNGELLSLIHK